MNHLKLSIAAAILGVITPSVHAQSVSQVDAQLVLEHVLALGKLKPLTDFNKWELDVWAGMAAACLHAAKMPESRLLASIPPRKNGTFKIPQDLAVTCKQLAVSGPDPYCFNYSATTHPFSLPYEGLSAGALYLSPGEALPMHNSWQIVNAQCLMNRNHPSSLQLFTGSAYFYILEVPTLRSVETAVGILELPIGVGQIRMDATTLLESDQMYLFAPE